MKLTDEQSQFINGLYDTYFKNLFIYARSSLKNDALAEEAVQETFRIACVKAETLREHTQPFKWLLKTLKYVIMNIRRVQYGLMQHMILSVPLDDESISHSSEFEPDVLFDEVYSRLLGEEDFRLVKMVVIEKETILEASKKLGISLEACKKRLQRAKKKIEKDFKNNS